MLAIETATKPAEPESGKEQSHERLKEGLKRDLGPVVMKALNDPSISEIRLNPDGKLWVSVLGVGKHVAGEMRPGQAGRLMTTIASMLGTTINARTPILEGELPIDSSRFEGLIPPVCKAPMFAIRKKAILIFTLEDYVQKGILSQRQYDAICVAIKQRKNILVVGGTDSGKTTFLNAVIAAISCITPDHRILIIEDTGEIQCAAEDFAQLRADAYTSMEVLLRANMRLSPDRIIVGEVRGPEVSVVLEAWNTGHPGGAATVHANNSYEGLTRIERLIEKGGAIAHPPTIAQAINTVVYLEKEEAGEKRRKVKEVANVRGYDIPKQQYILEHL